MRLTADDLTTDPGRPAAGATTPPPAAGLPPPAPPDPPLAVVEAGRQWTTADLVEIWRFRELFYYLTLRDIKLRYKQTVLGVGWSVFQPLATMLVFAVFIGWMGKVADGFEGSYTLFVLAGVLPWTFFANATVNAANSLVGNERLVTKTYFPRVLLPASNVGAAAFDFLVGVAILGIWVAAAGPAPTWRLAVVPVVAGLLAMTAFGVGTLLSALIANQRDFRYLLSFGVQLWMFATPSVYLPPGKYPFGPDWQRWLALNPAHGLVLNFRAGVLGHDLDLPALAVSVAVGFAALAAGAWYFRRVERTLADTI